MKRLFLFAGTLAVLLICSCSQISTRYVMTMPPMDPKPISGIDPGSNVILVTDKIDGQCTSGENFFLITESDDLGKKFTLNTASGECTFKEATPIPENGLYWDVLDEKKQSGGEACFQSFMMTTACGGKFTYGFSAERKFGCESDNKIFVSYSKEHREETWGGTYSSTTYTENASAATQKFLINGQVILTETYDGYSWVFLESGNIKGTRFYFIDDSSVVASCPEWNYSKEAIRTDMFFFNLNQKTCAGADLDFEKPYRYIDFFISQDKKSGYFIVFNEEAETYHLWTCSLSELTMNIKLLRVAN